MNRHRLFNNHVITPTLLLLVLCVAPLFAGAKDQGKSLSDADAQFIKSASQGNKAEVDLGQMAINRTQSSAIKNFGSQLVQDHSKNEEKLSKLADKHAVILPTDLSDEQQKLKDSLMGLSGTEFDQKYMSAMVDDHKKDIKEFEQVASHGENAQVKYFAQQTLPALKKHLRMAESIVKDQTH